MLFLVISSPRPEEPAAINAARQRFWPWVQGLTDQGKVKSVHAKVGRGAVVLFDVASNEELHLHLTSWSNLIPATFDIHMLIDMDRAREFLRQQATL